MIHYFERLERDIDFSREYLKLENMLLNEKYYIPTYGYCTINTWIEDNFRDWEKRGNYTSFSEVRNQVGFSLRENNGKFILRKDVGMEDYFLFCELIINILFDLREYNMSSKMEEGKNHLFKTIIANVENLGLKSEQLIKTTL